MRPKVLRIRFLPENAIAIEVPRYESRRCRIGAASRNYDAKSGRATCFAPRLGTLENRRGAKRAPPRALLQVVADLPYFDSRARFFKLLFDFIRLFLVDPLLDGLRRRLDKVLRLFQAEAGNRPDFLDDVDLFIAEPGQDYIELGLRLFDRRRSGTTAARRSRDRDRRGGGHAPLLLKHLRQLRRLEDGQRRQIRDQLR